MRGTQRGMELVEELLDELGLTHDDRRAMMELLAFLGETDEFRERQILRQFSALVQSDETNRPRLMEVIRRHLDELESRRARTSRPQAMQREIPA